MLNSSNEWMRSRMAGASESATLDPAQYAVSDYDALKGDGQRRVVNSRIRPEYQILNQQRRQQLSANTYDLYRNSVLLSWALRRHMDYICSWSWRPDSGDKGLDRDLQALMDRDSRPVNCDIGGRHSWARMLRLSELQKQLVGDCGVLPLQTGHVQGVESHHIRNPTGNRRDIQRWHNGCKLGIGRRTVAMCVHETLPDGTDRQRVVPRSRIWHHACFDFRFDQVRGISPVTTAVNSFRDTHETMEDIRSKLKLESILGVAFFQQNPARNPFETVPSTTEGTPEAPARPPHFELGKGAVGFGMQEKDKIETFQLTNPSSQTQEFLKLSILVMIKAFDLPFNFVDESNANFFSSRGAWQAYENSCIAKREDIQELNRLYTLFRTIRWTLPRAFGGTGEIVLPRGMDLGNLQGRWIPRGTPWWKPQEELTTDLMMVACGGMSFQDLCDKRGLGVWEDNVQRIRGELATANEAGLDLVFNQGKLPVSIKFTAALPAEPPGMAA